MSKSSDRWILTIRCAHKDCAVRRHLQCTDAKDYRENAFNSRNWMCEYHDPESGLLLPGRENNKIVTNSYVRSHTDKYPTWEPVGRTYIDGDGWSAYAKDFPPGTTITVSTQIMVVVP